MSHLRLIRVITIVAVAILSTVLTGTAAPAASADRTAPTAPRVTYAQGFYCLTLIMGAVRSTDNVTPESGLRYEVFADGTFIGLLDRGDTSSAWGVLALPHTGPNTVAVQSIDAAGNRSTFSNSYVVNGYYTPGSGCTPGRIF